MKILVLISTLLAVSFAFAKDGSQGWIATPYLGYESGSSTYKQSPSNGGGSGASTSTEIPVGVILGYSLGTFWFGADASYGASGTSVTTQPSGQPNTSYTRLGLGVDVGAKFGRNKIYINYIASNTETAPAQNGNASSTVTGTGYGLNYLFEITDHVAIGLNYYVLTPTQVVQSGTTYQYSNMFSTYSASSYGVMVAFPLVD